MKPDAPINTQSPVYQMVQEEEEMKAKGNKSDETNKFVSES